MEKIYTIPVNEAFDESGSCPFCRMRKKLEENEIDLILGASMMEPDIRIQTNEKGFCSHHFELMYRAQKRLPLALMLESHLDLIRKERKIYKGVCINVDFYSGFVYSMLNIPVELYTPIFAMARVVGWCAHRMEQLINEDKIMRPAYQSVCEQKEYVPMEKR